MRFSILLASAALLGTGFAAPASSQGRGENFTIAETGQRFERLSDAVDSIGSKNGTIVIASGRYRDCAVQQAGSITYRADVPGKAVFDGGICEDKAALVLRGRSATVEGIVFQNMVVRDGNGAGIRLETGDLSVSNSLFRNSEQGILTADDPTGAIVIDKTSFAGLGRCDRGLSCAHSIYIGNYGSLKVTRSRFERGRGGHYVKSRAARIEVTDSSFDDTQGRTTNYMIDLADGATGLIAGNIFVQGEDKENYSAFITVAPENRYHHSAGLVIRDNDARIAPGIDRSTVFVADWSGENIRPGNNALGAGLKPYERR